MEPVGDGSRLEKKPVAKAAWEKSQDPEPYCWPLGTGAGAARKKNTRSWRWSCLEKKIKNRSCLKEKSGAGAGAPKKLDGFLALPKAFWR